MHALFLSVFFIEMTGTEGVTFTHYRIQYIPVFFLQTSAFYADYD